MQKTFLKISSLVLCGLLIYNSLGYFIVLSAMRVAVKHQNWTRISNLPLEQLTTFVFEKNKPNPELKVLDEKEIQIDGKLYDVARKTDNGKAVTYYCLFDSKEEKLISKTRQFHSMSQPVPVKNTTRLILDNIIKSAVPDIKTERFILFCCHILNYNSSENYSGPVILSLIPPPKQCC